MPIDPRPALLVAALAALLTCTATRAATPPASPALPSAAASAYPAVVLADLLAGRLQTAETALRSWPLSTPDDDARQRRLQALVNQQRQLAARLLAQAEADLQQRRLSQAVERYEAALVLDDSLAQQPKAAGLLAARSRLWQARDAVARCMQPRDAACMDQAVREARTLAQHDPALALLMLQSAAWWVPGQPRRPAPVEGTTSSR